MQKLSLSELKSTEFEMLKYFRDFCEKNNIRYYLTYGTLLGAIRYKGFIPWDDDVDVLVPREDYNRLVATFPDSEQYRLYAFEREPKYRYPFAKLCDMSTRKEEFNLDNGVELGVDIDVFPLDYWDDDLKAAKKEATRINRYMSKLYTSKLIRSPVKNIIKRAVHRMIMFLYRTVGSKHYVKKIIKESYKERQKNSSYMGCKVWCIYGARGIIPAEVFSDTVEIEFEGEKFPAPVGYDTQLTCLYGDYLPEPPKEKQVTHHGFDAFKL